MAGIDAKISIIDDFSAILNKYIDLTEECVGITNKMAGQRLSIGGNLNVSSTAAEAVPISQSATISADTLDTAAERLQEAADDISHAATRMSVTQAAAGQPAAAAAAESKPTARQSAAALGQRMAERAKSLYTSARELVRSSKIMTDATKALDEAGKSSNAVGGGLMQRIYYAAQNISALLDISKRVINDVAAQERATIMLGDRAGRGLLQFAAAQAAETGRTTAEITRAGTAWANMGASGTDIQMLSEMTDRLAQFGGGNDYGATADKITNAIKSHSTAALADLLGGGDAIVRKLNRAGAGRALQAGNIQSTLQALDRVAESVGYTQSRAAALSDTLESRLSKIANIGNNIITRLASAVGSKIKPVISDIQSMLTDPAVTAWIDDIINMLASAVGWAANLVRTMISFVQNNKQLVTSVAILAGGFAAIRWVPTLIAGLSTSITLVSGAVVRLGRLLTSRLGMISMLILGIQQLGTAATGEETSILDSFLVFGALIQHYAIEITNKAANLVWGMMDSIQSAWTSVTDWIEDLIADLLDWVADKATNIPWLGDKLKGATDWMRTAASDLRTHAEHVPTKHKPLITPTDWRKDYQMASEGMHLMISDAKAALGIGKQQPAGGKSIADQVSKGMSDNPALASLRGDVSKMQGTMSREQDVRWLKELATQRWINNVNIKTMEPRVNVTMHNTGNTKPTDVAKVLAKTLTEMSAAGAQSYNAAGA